MCGALSDLFGSQLRHRIRARMPRTIIECMGDVPSNALLCRQADFHTIQFFAYRYKSASTRTNRVNSARRRPRKGTPEEKKNHPKSAPHSATGSVWN
ncbi:hypothetical protein NPIL_678091 [Nephila pilipes]|uniref:Uncharacterized protein n=1 Tax=Nephila pilipes TaxID=299642 RepID=A0A8X6MDT9_NEPPI|nr:hypothetical protein NPIL_678091 [Nephila pilipes]